MIRIETPEAKSGTRTLSVTDSSGRTIRLHSAFDPDKEAVRSVSTFETSPGRLILVTGCALAYHIKELKKKYPENTILVIERFAEITQTCLKIDRTSLEGIHLIHRDDEIPALFEQLNISRFKGTSVYFHRQSYMLDKEFYDSMVQSISQYLSSKISDLLTRFEFEERWVENMFANIPQLSRAVPVESFFNRYRGIPGILVSAGPSLKDNAAKLRKYQDTALIACVDTAYKVLQKFEVTPHIVMVLDAQKHSLLHFLGTDKTKTVLLADIVSCPLVPRYFKGPLAISTTSKYYDDQNGDLKRESTPGVEWLERHTTQFGDIQSGGSVATSLFDFLLNCGCSSITLIGQDLAYTGRKIHSSGTYHNERWLAATNRFNGLENINQRVVRKRKIRYVPSLQGKGILTDYVLDLYRRWFADSARRVSIPVYNATHEGAHIDGTTALPLESVMEAEKSTVNPTKITQQILGTSSYINIDRLLGGLEDLAAKCREIESSAQKGYNSHEAYLQSTRAVDDDSVKALFTPFMKRTRTYLDRHELDAERTRRLLLDDISRSANKIKLLINRTLRLTGTAIKDQNDE